MANDFVGIMGDLANFVQNERVAAYNEAVDEMLTHVKNWVREQKIDPTGDNIPDILNDFLDQQSRNVR